MTVAGIDLCAEAVRSRIEEFQLSLALDLLQSGSNVVIEWGEWAREERDTLSHAARSIGSPVELRYVTATMDELWRRSVRRDLEGRWGARSITRQDLEEWSRIYHRPTEEEMATYDAPSA
jgi:predicted kinase